MYAKSEKVECQKCHYENPDKIKFCGHCGAKLEIICPRCRFTNPGQFKFCGECGLNFAELSEPPSIDYGQPQSYTPKFLAEKILNSRSSLEGERKLVTVLFTDVANYTAMAERLDPEEVHQVMDGCFKIMMDNVHRYEGTINQFTGDGIMAIFGAPVAHENHAQRACYAALAIQRSLKKYSEALNREFDLDFRMRIGLNSGPVVVGAIGDDLRMDYMAIGDTTNLAARMESMARPGSILITRHTLRLVRDFFQFENVGKVRVKGKETHQEAFELRRRSDVRTKLEAAAARGLTTFVGRKRETEVLREAFEKARSGSGQVVGVVGEAGVGKSRLLLELRGILPKGGYSYLEGRCLHFRPAVAYLPILDILKSYFGVKEGDQDAVIKANLMRKILLLDVRLKSALSPLRDLLCAGVESESDNKLEPGQRRLRTFEAIRDLLGRESQRRPIVMAVENLQWIDEASEDFLDYLIGWLSNSSILLVLLYRPEYAHRWGSRFHYTRIALDQLSEVERPKLVQSVFEDEEIGQEIVEMILGRAGGNPLFVEELAHGLLESGTVERKDNRHVLAGEFSVGTVPDTVQGIIAARIDRVHEDLKRVLQVASVIGREFSFEILQNITGMERENLKSALIGLQALEFIVETQLFPEPAYRFKHSLDQEVTYQTLLLSRRREIHEGIGRAIESLHPGHLEDYYELLAYHFGRGRDPQKALEYLDLANRKAAELYALKEAEAYFNEAMKLLDKLPETDANRRRRISLLVNQSILFELLWKFPAYYDLLGRFKPSAIALNDPDLLGAFCARLGHCEWWFGYSDQAIETEGRALELCEAAGNAGDAGYAYLVLQWAHFSRGDFERCLSTKEETLRMMQKQFNLRISVWASCAAVWSFIHLGRWDEALEEARNELRAAREFSDESLMSFANWSIALVYAYTGDLVRAKDYGETAVRQSQTPFDKVFTKGFLAWIRCRAGEHVQGIEVLTKTIPIMRSGGFKMGETIFLLCLGEGHLLSGDYDLARSHIETALDLARKHGMKYYLGRAQRLLGDVNVETNPGGAKALYEESIYILRETGARNEMAMAYAGYGRLCRRQGARARAHEYFTKALEIFERLGTLIEPDRVRAELAELE